MLKSLVQDKIASYEIGWSLPSLGAAVHRLLARYGTWVRRRNDAARFAEMEPRLARDIGDVPGCASRPECFAVDPRPLWGIGLTPQPLDRRWPPSERGRIGPDRAGLPAATMGPPEKKEEASMPARFLQRVDEALAKDRRFVAAMRGLPDAAGTAGWPAAEQAARRASTAAVRRAFGHAARSARTSAFPFPSRTAIALCAAVGFAAVLGVTADGLRDPGHGDRPEILSVR